MKKLEELVGAAIISRCLTIKQRGGRESWTICMERNEETGDWEVHQHEEDADPHLTDEDRWWGLPVSRLREVRLHFAHNLERVSWGGDADDNGMSRVQLWLDVCTALVPGFEGCADDGLEDQEEDEEGEEMEE